MKLKKYFLSVLTIACLCSIELIAQDQQQEIQTQTTTQEVQTPQEQSKPATQTSSAPKPKVFPDDLSITEQFSFAIDKSSNFQDYKVIKQAWVTKLRANTLDTLQSLKVNLKNTKETIDSKNKEIDSLNAEVSTLKTELKEKNSFSLLGIMLSKSAYDSIMWSIIGGLLLALGFMFAAFRRSYAVTLQTKKDLNEVKDEFENFRKKALKSKEEAVRQLFDELNKYKSKK